MLSLDFKLTSGQVRALLRIWHGRTFERNAAPVLSLLAGHHDSFVTAGNALIRKGLVKHEPRYRADGLFDDTQDAWTVTPQGDAIAQIIVTQAALVMAVDASRRGRLAKERVYVEAASDAE